MNAEERRTRLYLKLGIENRGTSGEEVHFEHIDYLTQGATQTGF